MSETKSLPTQLPGFLEPAPFAVLKKQVDNLKLLSREEKYSVLTACVLAALEVVNFDESWYVAAYPDIKEAVKNGEFESGLHHYKVLGYFEGRLPTEIQVDEKFYCSTNIDVKKAINMGIVPGAKLHFLTKGYQEGRIPSSDYSFCRNDSDNSIRAIKKKIHEAVT